MMIGQIFLALFLAILLGLGISYFQDILPDFPGYASTLFANAMVIGQLLGNLLGGAMSHWVGLENVFFVSKNIYFHRNDIDILYERSKIYGSGCES